jgi:hypothetical protein
VGKGESSSHPCSHKDLPGEHWFYKHPGRHVKTATKVRPGIDIRGDGGYVVAPGSLHRSGVVYEEIEPWPDSLADLPPFPEALFASDKPSPKDKTTDAAKTAPKIYAEGTRNDSLFREGCRLRQVGTRRARDSRRPHGPQRDPLPATAGRVGSRHHRAKLRQL